MNWSLAAYTASEPRGRTHGIRSTYCHGCRCDSCRDAQRRYMAGYMAQYRARQASAA